MVQKVQAKIVSIIRLNDTIWQYTLKSAQFISYQAGQYLQIHKPEGENFYSIANAPSAEQVYELHVRHRSQTQLGSEQEALCVSLPYGRCDVSHLHPHKPILFLAFGTGFSSIRAMIEHLSNQSDTRPFELHWGVTVAEDLYDQKSLQSWEQTQNNYHYFPHIASGGQSDLIPFIIERYPDINHWQIVMAGPFDLMYDMQKKLLQHGCHKESIFSDAFEFAN